MDTGNKITTDIKEALAGGVWRDDTKLRAIHNLKKIFRPPDKILQHIKLKSLLDNAWVSLQYKAPEKNFLFKYGSSLVDFFGRDDSLNTTILTHLNFVLTELKNQDKDLWNLLVKHCWKRFLLQGISSKEFLMLSNDALEVMVCGWVENESSMEFLAKRSVDSSDLFQAMSSVLYQLLVKNEGNQGILKLTQVFVTLVRSICQKEKKNFLGLYPRDCVRLVSLLMISPEAYSEEGGVSKKVVGELLVELFWQDRNKAMIILSQYPDWMDVFKYYLNEAEVNKGISQDSQETNSGFKEICLLSP